MARKGGSSEWSVMRLNSSTGVSKIGVRPPAPALTTIVSMPPMNVRGGGGDALHVLGQGRIAGRVAGLAEPLQLAVRLLQHAFAAAGEEDPAAPSRIIASAQAKPMPVPPP